MEPVMRHLQWIPVDDERPSFEQPYVQVPPPMPLEYLPRERPDDEDDEGDAPRVIIVDI